MNSTKFKTRSPRAIRKYWIIGYVEKDETTCNDAFNYLLGCLQKADIEKAKKRTEAEFNVKVDIEKVENPKTKLKEFKVCVSNRSSL